MKTTRIDIRVQPDLKDLWVAVAKDAGMTLSEWIVAKCTEQPTIITTTEPIQAKVLRNDGGWDDIPVVRERKSHHPRCSCLVCKPVKPKISVSEGAL